MLRNALTIDVEDWYQTSDFNIHHHLWHLYEDRIAENMRRLEDILSHSGVKATFFFLGCIAQKHPDMVRRLSQQGHEIGSNGMYHLMVTDMSPEEFRKDVLMSKAILEDITGNACNLYRASSWSICRKNLWTLEILAEEGFVCDSSIQPFRTPLSGMANVPSFPFYPVVNGRKLGILEVPHTILKRWKLFLPFSGGFYFRFMPYDVVAWALKRVNRTEKGMVYIHPWEVDPEQPILKCAPHIRFEHYYHLNRTASKLERLLTDFSFVPLGEMVKDTDYNEYSL